ncbi:hypothetical protein F8M41_000241 [Gigaspora margarita]|uniref:Uncharacterized protein n=1 Tax=Gigaspora margarita TaxID=4874 RepID=A0A8H3XGB8_GIGMA|nr:hypothetical protein F8M41_000241 [Gigaspora margarita]
MTETVHKYFKRKSAKWQIVDFLNKCEETSFKRKIDIYTKSLEFIVAYNTKKKRRERAQTLLDRYRKGTCPDREESRRWKQKFELITEVPPQINVLDSSTVLNIAVGANNTISNLNISKKRKRNEDQKEVDDSPIRYDKFIKGINNAREDKTACLTLYASTNPLCWGIIDLRANNVAPCPNHPRAGDFFSDIEVRKLQQTCNEIIKKYSQLNSSVIELLEVLQSKTFSLKKFSKEKRARGIKGVCSLLRIETDIVDIYDKDTQYIGECLDVFGGWAPGIKFIYGESHSTADRDEKSFRSKCERTGKACDFLFWKNGYEIGIGENTGPMNKDHYKKSVTDFVSVIKVARAQHINFQTKCIEESGINPLPPEIENDLKLISIPFFQVIGMKIRFYILIQVDGDLYGIWEWSSQDLPTKEDDIISVVFLCKKFLIHRNLLNRTGQLSKTVIKNSQIFRENIENAEFVHYDKKSVKLSFIVSPKANRDNDHS